MYDFNATELWNLRMLNYSTGDIYHRYYKHIPSGKYYSTNLVEWIEKGYYKLFGEPSFSPENMLNLVEGDEIIRKLDAVMVIPLAGVSSPVALAYGFSK